MTKKPVMSHIMCGLRIDEFFEVTTSLGREPSYGEKESAVSHRRKRLGLNQGNAEYTTLRKEGRVDTFE
jgi:hypothetical protein